MTQAKFTRGPWMLEYGEVKHRPSSIRAVEGGISILRASAFCRVAEKETRANAHLMVAAPDMYEALEDAAMEIRHLARGTTDSYDAIMALLSKARGES